MIISGGQDPQEQSLTSIVQFDACCSATIPGHCSAWFWLPIFPYLGYTSKLPRTTSWWLAIPCNIHWGFPKSDSRSSCARHLLLLVFLEGKPSKPPCNNLLASTQGLRLLRRGRAAACKFITLVYSKSLQARNSMWIYKPGNRKYIQHLKTVFCSWQFHQVLL